MIRLIADMCDADLRVTNPEVHLLAWSYTPADLVLLLGRDKPPTHNPWATINPPPTGCVISGLCEAGWHGDCNQLPHQPDHTRDACPDDHPRRCVCPCHTAGDRETLF